MEEGPIRKTLEMEFERASCNGHLKSLLDKRDLHGMYEYAVLLVEQRLGDRMRIDYLAQQLFNEAHKNHMLELKGNGAASKSELG